MADMAVSTIRRFKRILGLKYSRCIDENKLGTGSVHNTQNPVAGGLGLFGGDRNLFAQHAV